MLKKSLSNQKGISTIELIPVLLLFALMFNFSLGLFGVIHSGILGSIAARNYAFETFRNRANLNYLRDSGGLDMKSVYNPSGFRYHASVADNSSTNQWFVTWRPIRFTDVNAAKQSTATADDHEKLVPQIADDGLVSKIFSGETPDDGKNGIERVWVRTQYGICLNSVCKSQ